MPEKRADSPASSARCVSQQKLTEPTSSQEKRLDARLETLRARLHTVDTSFNYMPHGKRTDRTG
jgi:hypothetical protein